MNYIVCSGVNPNLILTTTGEMKPKEMIGPGGYSAKIYKTWSGARVAADRRGGNVVEAPEER